MISLPMLDRSVFHRYAGLSLPRHVSYPMPTWWVQQGAQDAARMRADSAAAVPLRGLSLYLHLPFCEALCRFCACTRVIQRKTAPRAADRTATYLAALELEITRLGESLGSARSARQIHWGGGTPTYLSVEQIEHLHAVTRSAFNVASDAEVSIEIDPRVTSLEQLQTLRRIGFNRVSLGVQDFDRRVQEHVRRVQPYEMVEETVERCRQLGFTSVNFDLIYGLPYQSPRSLRRTLEQVVQLAPDRVAFYHYAQIPDRVATQRGIDHTKLPDSNAKLEMFLLGVKTFEAAGYEMVGLDHFAKPTEPLARALRDGTINRNFQGMTTGSDLDLVGAGASAISHYLGVGFLQNERTPDRYTELMNGSVGAVIRGKRLTEDDVLRQFVINQIYCHASILPAEVEDRFGVRFNDYFKDELVRLKTLEEDGLVEILDSGEIRLTFPLGRVLMRNVAAVFDAYLDREAYAHGESHVFSTNA